MQMSMCSHMQILLPRAEHEMGEVFAKLTLQRATEDALLNLPPPHCAPQLDTPCQHGPYPWRALTDECFYL